MSTLGDPLADLAITLVYWTEEGDGLRARVPVAPA
jgi:aminoglycoside phosphotransferase (APT) family kinase protein